jgi:hypothetical protein
LAHYEYVGNQPVRATDPSGHFKFYPDVQYQGLWQDSGRTYLENPRVTPQCRPCGSGWSLEFTVNVRILSQYSLFCPWFSKPHEALHVALFLQKAVFFANLYLKPREHAYPTYGECLRAGNEGKRLYEGIPKKEWDKGHDAIDKYIPCIWQL